VGQPILQLSAGWLFGNDEGEVALAVLCPRTLSVFSLRRKPFCGLMTKAHGTVPKIFRCAIVAGR
jgi:hypothetical protein